MDPAARIGSILLLVREFPVAWALDDILHFRASKQ